MKFNTILISIIVLGIVAVSFFSIRKLKREEFLYGFTKDEIALEFYEDLRDEFFNTIKNKLDVNYYQPSYDSWRRDVRIKANENGIPYEDQVIKEAQYLWEKRKSLNIYPEYERIVRIFNSREFADKYNRNSLDMLANRPEELNNKQKLLEIFYNI